MDLGTSRWLGLALASALAGGCALTSETIHLDYAPLAAAAPVAGAQAIRVQVQVRDVRQAKTDVVSHKGVDGGALTNDVSVPVLLGQAVAQELRARGYQVTGTGAVPLLLELTVFEHRFKSGFFAFPSQAAVTFLASVKDAQGRELFRDSFTGAFRDEVQVAGVDNAKEALQHALPAAVKSLMDSPALHQALARAAAPPAS